MPDNLSARLLPAVQVLALACLSAFGLQFIEEYGASSASSSGSATVLLVAALTSTGTIGVLWYLRTRLASHRARLACVLGATLVLAVITVFGRFTMALPAVILTVTLLVIESGWRAGATGALVFLSIWGTTVLTLSPDPPWVKWLFMFSTLPLLGIGMALGLLLAHNSAALAAQQEAVVSRDRALARLRRQGVLEKELLLARERDRAARELHDGLGHQLALVSMSLELAERTRHHSPEAAWQEVITARRATTKAMEDMRTWVRALSPARPSQATGLRALRVIADSFRSTDLHVELVSTLDEEVAPPEPVDLLMRRTVQEGLTNALRHAAAREVVITLDLLDTEESQQRGDQSGPWWVLSVVSPLAGEHAEAAPPPGQGNAHPDVQDDSGSPGGSALGCGADSNDEMPGPGAPSKDTGSCTRAGLSTSRQDIPVPRGLQVSPGFGLAGLAERAGELGGRVDAARTPDSLTGCSPGCFVLRLSLPATDGGLYEDIEGLTAQDAVPQRALSDPVGAGGQI